MRREESKPPERVLLTFTGFHDPFASAAVAGNEQEGPVLSLVRLRQFDRVVLFSTPSTVKNTADTADHLRNRHPNLKTDVYSFAFNDPTDYFAILASLRSSFRRISERIDSAVYFVGTASGTPQMHACWLLLAASGEIPARLLHARNVKFVTRNAPAVTDVDLSRPEFPIVRSNMLHRFFVEDGSPTSPSDVIQKLGIIGDHELIVEANQRLINLAPYDIPILLTGESGTGKEKSAELIHYLSPRAGGPFVPVNCAAVPRELAESVLFGHVRGAFSGAVRDQKGKFELAHGGTLFLDEIAELSTETQAKLLRALETKQIDPVGADRPKPIDCHVIAATNVDVRAAVNQGRFREDLYFRIGGAAAVVELPPLRARRSDIPKLAQHFLDELNQKYKKSRAFAPETLALMQSYHWPGNVRELSNVVQNAAVQATKGLIEPTHLSLEAPSPIANACRLPEPRDGFSLEEYVTRIRHELYGHALKLAKGNASQAARLLQVSPQAVLKHLKTRGD